MELQGKTVLFLGSSLVVGSHAGGVSVAELVAEQLDFHLIKVAVSGTTLADINDDSYVARLKKVPTDTKVDLFVCQVSTNDHWVKADPAKTEEAVRFITDYAKRVFGAPVIFFTAHDIGNPNYETTVEIVERLQAEYGYAILNLYRDRDFSALTPEQRKTYLAPDGVHPTLAGYRDWWTPKFKAFFESL